MKFILIATIVALFALADAVRILRADVDQLRQCTCDEQYKGIREWKESVVQCHDQCRSDSSSIFRSIIDTPVKIYPCLDHKVDMVHRLFDCVNAKMIQADSCVSNVGTVGTGGQGQGQSLTSGQEDFRQLIVRYLDPIFDEFRNTMDLLDQQVGQQQQQKFGRDVLSINDCLSTCYANKIKQTRHWDQVNCLPKVNQNLIQQHLQTCVREMNLKNTIYKTCTCMVEVGAQEIQPYCQKLRTLQFPQWAQGQGLTGGMMQGQGMDMGDDNDQIFDQSGQIGQQYQRGQKLLVKLAIQQEEPDFQGSTGLGQGFVGSQRSFGQVGSLGGQRSFGGQGYQGSIGTTQGQIGNYGSTGYRQNKYQSDSVNL